MSPENPKQAPGYDDPPMTIWDHLAELRKRLIISVLALVICAAISWEFRELILATLVKPFSDAWRNQEIPGTPMLHFQTPAAAFLAYFKLSLLAGAALSSPLIFLQLWLFVAPGLYAKEKRFVIPFVVSSTALFVGGGYFGWRLVFPIAFEYLLSLSGQVQQGAEGLVVSPTVMMGDYIGFVTRLLLGFGLIFEIPLFVFFMSVTGIVNYLQLIRVTRWVVVGAFAFAAILTPPDWTSQLMMAVPMIGLYGISILLAYIFGKPPSEEQRAAYKKHKEQARVERAADRERKKKDKEAEKKAKKAKKAEQTRKKTSKGR